MADAPRASKRSRGGTLLTLLFACGFVAGVLYGEHGLFGGDPVDAGHWTKQAGDLVLVRPLALVALPLVFVSVVAGVASINAFAKVGVVGGTALFYFLVTMLIAVAIGTALVTAIQPGNLAPDERGPLVTGAEARYARDAEVVADVERARQEGQDSLGGAWMNVVSQVVPRSVFAEIARGRTLGVIAIALLLGLALAAGGASTEPAVRVFDALLAALLRIVGWLVCLAPIGVFFLVAWTVGRVGLAGFAGPLLKYLATVGAGLVLHGAIVLPMILLVFGRTNPYQFMWRMRHALLTALGTASSSATLPVTIATAIERGGCSKRATGVAVPLGAAVNLEGTALFEAVAAIFLFQLFGIPLEAIELLIVVITATLAAIGASGIPSAGLATLVIVISAVNTSLAARGSATLPISAIGVIVGVDRVVDMLRTAVNVWGDAVGAKIISRIVPDPAG
jgi:Na+/H+-dicarboxylate symporter